jgi:hypothetical protein
MIYDTQASEFICKFTDSNAGTEESLYVTRNGRYFRTHEWEGGYFRGNWRILVLESEEALTFAFRCGCDDEILAKHFRKLLEDA